MDFLYLTIGLILGIITAWFAFKNKSQKNINNLQNKIIDTEKINTQRINEIDKEKSIINERLNTFQIENKELEEELSDERSKSNDLSTRIAKAGVEYKNLQEKLETQKTELKEIQKKFTTEFENIANKILKQNSLEFTTANQKNIGEILNPLKEKILTFEKKVEDTYQKGLKDQTDLKAELKKLHELNFKISEEASNLTKALKADTKKQGNWGEIILERVLERSGLTKGQEYETQLSTRNEQGDIIRPDVIVNLPDNKHIIIDSKVSLLAYEAYINEENQQEKEKYLKQHIDSIKNHVKGLSEKNYQNASLFDTPDFVLLFMPIESAFSITIQSDPDLFNFAWEKKIVIVSPTTLLATLRTVASIWKHEKQTQNALEIARQGGALYDKFEGLLTDLEKIGTQLNTVQKTYDDAHKKLTSGRGNLITQVEKIKKLGAKASKSLPAKYIEEN
ncbi:MAG: DNA recombination protein RmuC [Bacteroidales bacterium]|nr:DNA recombination protein RmuC [Bacteroidales bacterium]